MDKQINLAVAGAGKTYFICHSINLGERNLILAFTHENIHNIRKELLIAYGCIPTKTTILTFDAFVYRFFVCPYEPTIKTFFKCDTFLIKGITTSSPPPNIIKKGGRCFHNPYYINKDCFGHYVDQFGYYYCSRLSEMIMFMDAKKNKILKRATNRLNLFFDKVLIDEFQDFREFDFELIISISYILNNILLVGDYYQHSVSAINNSGKPFKAGKTDVTYADFVKELKKLHFKIDDTSLNKSRRCSDNVCSFVKEKLGINIESDGKNNGNVLWIEDEEKLISYLDNRSLLKLVFRDSERFSFNSMNWSYSKGDTFNEVCVILTDNFESLDKDDFSVDGIPISTVNKLYVALTRTKGNLYLVKNSLFRKVSEQYFRK
ncbi:AAA family ATPase [bacterium]|nr:AAA family ATPase [bacterium]